MSPPFLMQVSCGADTTMFFCNCQGGVQVARLKFHASVLNLAMAANLGNDDSQVCYQIQMIQFCCCCSYKGCAVFASLRLGRARWKVQEIFDDWDHTVRFYVGPDKTPSQITWKCFHKLA